MDLPTCPACGQSVLDDDAEDCPFCGSSMSGSPVAKAPQPAAAAKTQSPAAAEKPAKKATAGKSKAKAAPAADSGDSDDPFAVAAPASTKAVPLRTKPEKGRRHLVICPMCETRGYTARKAAGMEVRCANPDCLIPVFTAPPIEEESTEEETEAEVPVPPWKSPANIAAVGAVVAAIGVGIWFFAFRDPAGKKKQPVNPVLQLGQNKTGGDPKTKTPGEGGDGKQPKQKQKKVVKLEPLPELRAKALTRMEVAIGDGELPSTLRPASFQLIADAYAQIGKTNEANGYINRLANVAANVPFYAVRPLVEAAWQEMNSDAKDSKMKAGRLLESASVAAQSLVRQTSRIRQDTVSILAAALYAYGKKDDARKLIDVHADNGDIGQSSLALVTTWHTDDFDFHRALLRSPYVDPAAYQYVAVARILISRGRPEAALEWARAQTSEIARRACLLAWAEGYAAQLFAIPEPQFPMEEDPLQAKWDELNKVISQWAPAARLAAYARIAVLAENKKQSALWLKKAADTVKDLPAPQIMKLPVVTGIFKATIQSPSEKLQHRRAAIAFAELARAENHWDKQAGWKSLSRSLAHTRSLAYSPTGVRERKNMTARGNVGELRSQLAREFNLEEPARISQKVREYDRKCDDLLVDADRRMRFQIRLLEWSVDWSSRELAAEIWKEVAARADEKRDAGEREPYFAAQQYGVRIPWMLATKLIETGDQPTATAIRQAIEKTGRRASLRQRALDYAVGQVVAGKFAAAASPFNALRRDAAWRRQQALALAVSITRKHGVAAGYEFVDAIKVEIDPYLKFDAFDLIAAFATRNGQVREAWKLISERDHPPENKVAFCHGFVIGIGGPGDKQVADPEASKTAAILNR